MFESMFETKKTLIVVYRDEMLLNQLRKMIDTKDDKDGEIVGTKDDSVDLVAWEEKVWLDNKKSGTINEKILFLGRIKGTETLIPTLDMKFNSFGAQFGISGNQAVLFANPNILARQNDYNAFLRKLSLLPVPEIIKKSPTKPAYSPSDKKNSNSFLDNAKSVIGKVVDHVDDKTEELFRNKALVERQIMFYGVNMLYNGFLEEYMNL